MAGVQSVKLELLRAGPIHNQLLSPLTPYLALSSDEGPVTVHLELEHRELLNRLSRLAYTAPGDGARAPVSIAEKMRQSEVVELGAIVGRILGKIPTLPGELGRAQNGAPTMINLRVILSGSELSLIPFELATSPQGFPGEGLPLLLQSSAPITMTREVRRGSPLRVDWNRKPRILFVSAAPKNPVPARAHVQAIREALEPWVKWAHTPEVRDSFFSEHLTVLEDASLEQIRDACAEEDYTHVHILAHGARREEAGEQRFGIELFANGDRGDVDVVDGQRLAQALQTVRTDGRTRSHPAVVTLMTCDSGNVGSVLVPGGSIAHALQAYGIPWILASQLPLTIPGSITIAKVLYRRLLRGDDPRLVVHELRHRLKTASSSDHDWASLVAYSALPPDFECQLASFRELQRRRAIDVDFYRAEEGGDSQIQSAFEDVRRYLHDWEKDLPEASSLAERTARAECLGKRAASEKRMAQLYYRRGEVPQALAALEKARSSYERAARVDLNNHWTATQLISLSLVLDRPVGEDWWALARLGAARDLQSGVPETMAWAHGSLAELDMLAVEATPEACEAAEGRVRDHCQTLVQLMGEDSFAAFSTKRQFEMYIRFWTRPEWKAIAEAAVKALKSPGDRYELPTCA